jgi:hypothetical protein
VIGPLTTIDFAKLLMDRALVTTHLERLKVPAAALGPGVLVWETDRKCVYITERDRWVLLLGGMRADSLADVPTDLGPDDAGFTVALVPFSHSLRWSGDIWEFAAGDGNGFIQDAPIVGVADPAMWTPCDGRTSDYLVVNAPTLRIASVVLPVISGRLFRR